MAVERKLNEKQQEVYKEFADSLSELYLRCDLLLFLSRQLCSEEILPAYDLALHCIAPRDIGQVNDFCRGIRYEVERTGGAVNLNDGVDANRPLVIVATCEETLSESYKEMIEDETNVKVLETYGNGTITLIKAIAYQPDVIVADVTLIGMGGCEMVHNVKNHHKTNKVSVVVITARGTEYDRARGILAGADDYLVIPQDAENLVSRVKRCL